MKNITKKLKCKLKLLLWLKYKNIKTKTKQKSTINDRNIQFQQLKIK